MRTPFLACLLVLLTSVAFAEVRVYPQKRVAERPTRLVAKWKDKAYPVVAFSRDRPVVDVDGKRRTTDREGMALGLAPVFAPGYVTVQNTSAQRWEVEQFIDGLSLGSRPGWSKFQAELSADRDMDDVFMALVVFETSEAHLDAPPGIAILGVPVGDLKKDEKRRVSAVLPPLRSDKKISWAALVYCREGQVQSSGPEQIVSVFFDRLERHTLMRRINERILAGQDAPLQLLRHLPIVLDDELMAKYDNQQVKVGMYVNIDGTVDNVHLVEPQDRQLLRQLEPQLRQWLFVPPMKEGLIVRQQVVLPLRL